MTTKTITFDPVPDDGTFTVTIGGVTTAPMGPDWETVSAGDDYGVRGQLRRAASGDLDVSGNFADGFVVTNAPALTVDAASLTKAGGTVEIATVQAKTSPIGTRERQRVYTVGATGEHFSVEGIQFDWDVDEIEMQDVLSAYFAEPVYCLKTNRNGSDVARDYDIWWKYAGAHDLVSFSGGTLDGWNDPERITAGDLTTAGTHEIQRVTMPPLVQGGTWQFGFTDDTNTPQSDMVNWDAGSEDVLAVFTNHDATWVTVTAHPTATPPYYDLEFLDYEQHELSADGSMLVVGVAAAVN